LTIILWSFSVLNMATEQGVNRYLQILSDLEQASRQHAATKTETQGRQVDRAKAIVEVSKLGVPRATVAKLAGLTRGRIQQILEQAGEAGATGEDWNDPELRRLVKAAVAARPIPSAGIGLRRESTLGPHLGQGAGVAVRLTGDLDKDRNDVISMIERLLEKTRSGDLDHLLSLTEEELEVVRGNLIDDQRADPSRC
jgi:hypothetical protein